MNSMAREMKTQGAELRTRYHTNDSGLLYLEIDDPRALLTFIFDSETLQDDITQAIKGLFLASQQINVDLLLLGQEDHEFIWSVTTPDHSGVFERTLQVA